MRMLASILLVVTALVGCNQTGSTASGVVPVETRASTESGTSVRNTPSPDNTAVNKRDASTNTKTPLDQKENQADVNLTAKIRQLVVGTKDLSVNARNAKIITADGKVTLRGPVASSEERDTLERIARGVAGDGNVDNQLEVAPSTEARR